MTFLIDIVRTMKSANLAIGVATIFVAMSTCLGLFSERNDVGPSGATWEPHGPTWSLRGAMIPAEFATRIGTAI